MKSALLVPSLLALLAATPALAQTAADKPASSAEKQFIDHVARDGNAEIQLVQLAEQKAASSEVKRLAQRLGRDHRQSNEQLAQIAQQQGVPVPKGIGKSKEALRSKLEKLNGSAFDHAFLQAQIDDHRKDIKYFQHEEASLKNPQLKAFAQQTLPVLRTHLQLAEQTAHQARSGSSMPNSTSEKR